MRHLLWWLGQAVPHSYHSQYGDTQGNTYVAVWHQWLGRISDHRRWRVVLD